MPNGWRELGINFDDINECHGLETSSLKRKEVRLYSTLKLTLREACGAGAPSCGDFVQLGMRVKHTIGMPSYSQTPAAQSDVWTSPKVESSAARMSERRAPGIALCDHVLQLLWSPVDVVKALSLQDFCDPPWQVQRAKQPLGPRLNPMLAPHDGLRHPQ